MRPNLQQFTYNLQLQKLLNLTFQKITKNKYVKCASDL